MRIIEHLSGKEIENIKSYLMARMARTRHEADGLFKSRCNLFQAATLNPFCGVDDMISKLFPSNSLNESKKKMFCMDFVV